MIELKADNTFVFGEECLAYKKSEADAVIAEKDEEIADLTDKLQKEYGLVKESRDCLIESQKMHKRCADNAIKVIRNNKWMSLTLTEITRICGCTRNGTNVGWNLPRNSNLTTQPPSRAKDNKMGDTNEAEISQRVAKIETRTNCQCLCDLAFELRELDHNIQKLKNAIEANPPQVREAAKALWPNQLEAMKAYKLALFARIRDLMNNDND